MKYGQANMTLGEKIVAVVGFLFLATVVAALVAASQLIAIA